MPLSCFCAFLVVLRIRRENCMTGPTAHGNTTNAISASFQSIQKAAPSTAISDAPSPKIENAPLVTPFATMPTSLTTRDIIIPVGVRLKNESDIRCSFSLRPERMSSTIFCPIYAFR